MVSRFFMFMLMVLTLSGCQMIRDETVYLKRINEQYQSAFREMSRDVRFDPVLGRLYWNEADLSVTWERSFAYGQTIAGPYRISTVNNGLKSQIQLDIRNILSSTVHGDAYFDSATEQVVNKGWAIIQRDRVKKVSAKSEVSVPVLMLAWVEHQRGDDHYSYVYSYPFDISTRSLVMIPMFTQDKFLISSSQINSVF